MERVKKRIEVGDAEAMCELGCCYQSGAHGLPQDLVKAFELWHRAGELGNVDSHCNIAYAYDNGEGVTMDEKKAKHYYELSAIRGDMDARFYLASIEKEDGNMDRALKHYIIASGGGDNVSLKKIKLMYKDGHATKDDHGKALQAYESYIDEIKSDLRDEAAAFDEEEYKYY